MSIYLGIVGLIALLGGLLGYRFLPRARHRWAGLTALLGLVLVALALWIYVTNRPRLTVGAAPTTTASVTASPAPLGHPPVILDIITSRKSTSIGMVVQAAIHFQDEDGDALQVAFALDKSSVLGVSLGPLPVDASPQEQQQGATLSVEWDCQHTYAVVLFKTLILDQAGHRSNLVPLLFNCG